MPSINRDGVKIYYEVHGQGTPLLLTHGYSSTSAMWQGQIELLAAKYKLITWDMRGHGNSDYPEDPLAYSEPHTVADMAAILDKVAGPGCRAIVGGLSLGGYMSMAFYNAHTDRVISLLIIDTGPGFKKDSAREAWNTYARKQGDEFDKNGLGPLQNLSPERSQVSHRDASGIAHAARGMLTQRDSAVINSLGNIKAPSLVLVGSEDKGFLAATDYMASKIPRAKKVIIPKAGHAANIDNPEAFNKELMAFLSSLGDDRRAKASL
jgi:pimeloyl-ACP methyl ester carboxylesterase